MILHWMFHRYTQSARGLMFGINLVAIFGDKVTTDGGKYYCTR